MNGVPSASPIWRNLDIVFNLNWETLASFKSKKVSSLVGKVEIEFKKRPAYKRYFFYNLYCKNVAWDERFAKSLESPSKILTRKFKVCLIAFTQLRTLEKIEYSGNDVDFTVNVYKLGKFIIIVTSNYSQIRIQAALIPWLKITQIAWKFVCNRNCELKRLKNTGLENQNQSDG